MAKQKKATPPKGSVKGDQAEQVVLDYLKKQNRPYSANDVFNNLHGSIGKTLLAKILTTLSDGEEIVAKTYGKQCIYVARQDSFESPSTDQLDGMDNEIKELKDQITEIKSENKKLADTLSELSSSLTTVELQNKLNATKKENEKYIARLEVLRQGQIRISEEEKKKIDEDYEKCRKFWKSRKRLCMDIVHTICDSMEKKPADFMEELGLDTDEMVGVDYSKDPLEQL